MDSERTEYNVPGYDASNLVPEDGDGRTDVFVRQLRSARTRGIQPRNGSPVAVASIRGVESLEDFLVRTKPSTRPTWCGGELGHLGAGPGKRTGQRCSGAWDDWPRFAAGALLRALRDGSEAPV